MSDTLAAAKAFTYKARSSSEVPAKTGQFLTVFTESEVALQRPDKLQVNVGGDLPDFRFYYNGRRVSAFDQEKNLFATTEAPATVDATLPIVTEKMGISIPAADFLFSNPYQVMTKELSHAIVVGPAKVGGIPCDHFAYMNPGVNWEVWIESGATALPRRLAVTYKDVQNFPRFVVEFDSWSLKPGLSPGLFDFKQPAKAKEVEFGSELLRTEK